MGTDWKKITREDLAAFDDIATRVILYAMRNGGVGRISRNNHCILRAPDGSRTMSVPQNGTKSQQVLEIEVRKLFPERAKKAQPPSPALVARPAQIIECGVCDYTGIEGAVYQHRHEAHHVCTHPGCQVAFDDEAERDQHSRIHTVAQAPTRVEITVPPVADEPPAVVEAVKRGKHARRNDPPDEDDLGALRPLTPGQREVLDYVRVHPEILNEDPMVLAARCEYSRQGLASVLFTLLRHGLLRLRLPGDLPGVTGDPVLSERAVNELAAYITTDRKRMESSVVEAVAAAGAARERADDLLRNVAKIRDDADKRVARAEARAKQAEDALAAVKRALGQ